MDLAAVASEVCGTRPFFVTVTPTRQPGSHTDVSLWHVLDASAEGGRLPDFDAREYRSMRWAGLAEVAAEPIGSLDPHMHRFTAKLRAALDGG